MTSTRRLFKLGNLRLKDKIDDIEFERAWNKITDDERFK